jgi:septum site-determining protein MinC
MSHQQYPSLSLDSRSGESGSAATSPKAYELKGFTFSVLTMCLKQTDVQAIEQQLTMDLAKLPDVVGEPVVVDLHDVSGADVTLDFPALFTMMYRLKLTPVGICNGSEVQKTTARASDIPILQGGSSVKRRPNAAPAKEPEAPPKEQAPATHIIDTPVRTGQRVFSKGDLTLLAGVNAGAEVLAAGSIHVYGPLRGRALAGVTGDRKARIFTKCMEAELVSIAGCFRVLENDLDVQGKPAQIYLDGERVVIKPL